ncbi:MAG TPA: DUF1631 family protein [Patescibacteria group bacterium]|nr:DUF1631 family protein [Patescibacteria group bacterium]
MLNVVESVVRHTPAGHLRVLFELSGRVVTPLTGAFRETLASCDDLLFGHAQRAVNGTRQAQFFDDLRQLRRHQEAATRAFSRACKAQIEGGAGEPMRAVNKLSEDPLQLVADEDLELDLALFRVGKRCDDAAPRLRHQVQRRLDVLQGLPEGAANLLAGAMIGKCCRAGLLPLELGLESKLIVLKQLERRLEAEMEPLLESVNALLLELGILPNLRATPAAPRAVSSIAAPARNNAGPVAPTPVPDVHQLGEVLSRMTQWMAQQQSATDEAPMAALAPQSPTPMAQIDAPEAFEAGTQASELEQQRERRRLEIAARRAQEMARARELRGAAEKSADSVVSTVLTQAHVPECIGNVMRGPLRRHLEIVHARRGDTSTEWRSACKLVRDIAWALDPETANVEQAHWRAMVPGIVASLRAALITVGTDEHEIDRIVANFGARYEHMLVSDSAPIVDAAGAAPETDIAMPADVSQKMRATPNFSEALRRVRQLVLGQWFELLDDQGHMQRAKLVWTSAMTERCLFVNGHGKLVADRPHARVATDLLAGQFREINDAALATA